jgi:hypothetical protein
MWHCAQAVRAVRRKLKRYVRDGYDAKKKLAEE